MSTALNWTLLANSLLVALATAVFALGLGFMVALFAASMPRAARRLVLAGCIAVLALPSFLVTNCWIDLFGTNGVLPLNIFSLAGVIWILVLMLWPIPALAIWSAWQKLEPVHFEIDPALRGFKLIKLLLWPAAKSIALISMAVVFALALNNFAVPAILQVKVFPAEMWVQFSTNLDTMAALKLSWPMLLVPLTVLAFIRSAEFPWLREANGDCAGVLQRQLGGGWLIAARLTSGCVIALALFAPVAQLAADLRTWIEFGPAITAGFSALINSLVYAASAAVLTVALGLLLARVRMLGWTWLFFLVPGVLLGISALTTFNRPGLEFFSRTAAIVIALLVVRHVALARSISRTALLSIDSQLLDSARLDGAAGATLFRRIVLPQIAPQVAAAAYIVYVLCLWDVETILLVIPPGGETLALRIFNLLHYGHNAHVNALCLLLLLLALAPLTMFVLWKSVKRT
jgi:iron(III) transport system permease protein